MELKNLTEISHLHHAYLVIGGTPDSIYAVLKKRGEPVEGSSDLYSISVVDFGIEGAREIATFASLKPLGERKYIIVSFSRATTEAQNALLKVVEEAPGSSVFFFCVESAGHVLPTLQSRCIPVSAENTKDEADVEDAEKFLAATFEERLTTVESMTSYISKTQDRGPARNFVRMLIKAARARRAPVPNLKDLLDANRYMHVSGSSAKSILSHLAVTLPKI